MKSVNYNFKGLMFPAFTPFMDDKKRTINYDMIDKYAQYMKSKGMHGVMVNGATGEGLTLRVEERKRLAEEWLKVARKHQLSMLLQIGGTNVADVYDLAEHAEKIGVDAVLLLPALFYRPYTEEDLVHYIREVAQYCPSLPVLYYHIPTFTKVYLSMWRLYDLAEKDIPNFSGLFFAHGKLDDALLTKNSNRLIIYAHPLIMGAAMLHGIQSLCMIHTNLMPEMMMEFYEHMRNMRMRESMELFDKMFRRMYEFWHHGEDIISLMKIEWNKVNSSMKMGPMRKPLFNISKRMY